jgi:hypothetical protein
MTGEHTGGTCFGFSVAPSLELNYLRGGSGDPLSVEIDATPTPHAPGKLLREWTINAPEPFRASLYAHDGAYRLWAADTGWFAIDPVAGHISLPASGNAVKREERLWGIPALLCFVGRGDVPLHAAAVDTGRGALVLSAPGRFGKTTLAAAFVRAGHRLLTEDLTCVRFGAEPATVPGPAMLRIRPDVADALDIPRAQVLAAGDERLHLALDPRERGDCAPVPIRAVVFLRGGTDDLELRRVEPHDAIRDLFALSFRLPGADETSRAFGAVAQLAAAVPAWDVAYPLRLDELDRVVEAVARL